MQRLRIYELIKSNQIHLNVKMIQSFKIKSFNFKIFSNIENRKNFSLIGLRSSSICRIQFSRALNFLNLRLNFLNLRPINTKLEKTTQNRNFRFQFLSGHELVLQNRSFSTKKPSQNRIFRFQFSNGHKLDSWINFKCPDQNWPFLVNSAILYEFGYFAKSHLWRKIVSKLNFRSFMNSISTSEVLA